MINTQAFKIKTIFQPRLNPSVPKYWGVAIDIGYSSVKIFSPNMVASFPAYAKKVPYGTADHSIGELERNCIVYRDNAGNEYFVGAVVQDGIETDEADNSTAVMTTQNRYSTAEFKVILRVGLALGTLKNQYGDPSGRIMKVQTGLPPEYIKTGRIPLENAFLGTHDFSIKLGANKWMDFHFNLAPENIDKIMAQPMGTLISISKDKNGGQLPEAQKYFKSKILIIDPGFGTFDTFALGNHIFEGAKTWSNLGMRRVLEETSKLIEKEYNTYIPVPAMQKILGDGYFKTQYDPVTRRCEKIDFAPLLEEANKMVCNEAITTLDSYYNYLQHFNYLVISGGTGAAWSNMIKNAYSGMETLQIIYGAVNDTIPSIFNNVRGYYFNQLNLLKHK